MQQVFELLVLATRLQDFRNGDSYIVKPAKNSLETILVVEDDPIVLGAVGAILEGAGFCVLTATNSTEAIKKEDSYYETIHLLISGHLETSQETSSGNARDADVRLSRRRHAFPERWLELYSETVRASSPDREGE